MIRWIPLIAAALLALSACSTAPTPTLKSNTSQLEIMAKGSGGTTESSLSLVMVNAAAVSGTAAVSSPRIGDQVTFEVKTKAAEPWVRVTCYVGGIAYYTKIHGFFPSYEGGQIFTLGPNWIWTNQTANCTAELVTFSRGKTGLLATTNFTVVGQ